MISKAYFVANSINLATLSSERKYREVSCIDIDENKYVIFPYGVIVCWGDGKLSEILTIIASSLEGPVTDAQMLVDEFDVVISESEKKLIFEDTIYLEEVDELQLIALSHPIAQSIRLSQFELETLQSIERIKHIPQSLSLYGKIKESKKNISKMQGHLYSLKGKISFEHSILDKPEFFWEYPEFDGIYERMANYLEIQQRIHILDKKHGTIDEILSIFSDELNHRHSSKLEVIIILLILIEIIIFFLQDVFKLIE